MIRKTTANGLFPSYAIGVGVALVASVAIWIVAIGVIDPAAVVISEAAGALVALGLLWLTAKRVKGYLADRILA